MDIIGIFAETVECRLLRNTLGRIAALHTEEIAIFPGRGHRKANRPSTQSSFLPTQTSRAPEFGVQHLLDTSRL
jgi:hypothetical protein